MRRRLIEFYEIDDDYIDYLQKFDSKIYSTKAGKRNFYFRDKIPFQKCRGAAFAYSPLF